MKALVDPAAMLLALVALGLLVAGQKAEGAAVGVAALTVLAVGSWAKARAATRRIEELQRQVASLERLASAGLATAGFAHELKNHLMVTHGFAQLARKSALDANVPPRVLDQLGEVEAQATRLTDRLRSFMRLASETPEHLERPLNDVVEEVCALAGPLARQKNLAFEQQLAPLAEVRTVTDPGFTGALLDLALNAIEHANGAVWLRLEEADGVRLVVEDDGNGVPEAMRERLFTPFATGRPGGLGLGLPRARASFEADGWRVRCEDRPGGGARFVVTAASAQP